MTKEEQAVEYANRRFATTRGFDGAVINNFLREGFLAGFTAGAAHERARAEGLVKALELVMGLLGDAHEGDPYIAQEVPQSAIKALAEYKRQRGEA